MDEIPAEVILKWDQTGFLQVQVIYQGKTLSQSESEWQ